MSRAVLCDHFREDNTIGSTKVTHTLCGRILRRNSGVMTMHYRMEHNRVARTVLSNYFQETQVGVATKAVCVLCGRVLRRNVRDVHHHMVHYQCTTVPRHICGVQEVGSTDDSGFRVAGTTQARSLI
jgi:lysyl-tRNA synthetase class I